MQSDGSCTISTNESEFAQRTGMSRETVNREMMKLRREGVLSRNGKVITVQRVAQLHDLLDTTL
jgi:DNA-binding Lrp family transcriptional regulator